MFNMDRLHSSLLIIFEDKIIIIYNRGNLGSQKLVTQAKYLHGAITHFFFFLRNSRDVSLYLNLHTQNMFTWILREFQVEKFTWISFEHFHLNFTLNGSGNTCECSFHVKFTWRYLSENWRKVDNFHSQRKCEIADNFQWRKIVYYTFSCNYQVFKIHHLQIWCIARIHTLDVKNT